jgi:hypothetical protein
VQDKAFMALPKQPIEKFFFARKVPLKNWMPIILIGFPFV